MKTGQVFVLSNNQKISAKELACILNITPAGARKRLSRTLDANLLFQDKFDSRKVKPTVWTLDNGVKGTVRELALKSKIKENTLRQRLQLSSDPTFVFRQEEDPQMNALIYMLEDGTETDVKDFARLVGCSDQNAYETLKYIAVSKKRYKKSYRLSNSRLVTLEEVVSITGLSESAAKKRLNKSKCFKAVLKPSRYKIVIPQKGIAIRQCAKTGKAKVKVLN